MSIEKNKDIARRYNEQIWSNGDLTVIDEIVSPEYIDHTNPEARTREGLKKNAAAFHANNSDVWITVEDQIAEGHLVMNRLAGQGIDNATGKKWKLETFFDVFRIMDGRIVEFWHAHDSLALMKQLEE